MPLWFLKCIISILYQFETLQILCPAYAVTFHWIFWLTPQNWHKTWGFCEQLFAKWDYFKKIKGHVILFEVIEDVIDNVLTPRWVVGIEQGSYQRHVTMHVCSRHRQPFIDVLSFATCKVTLHAKEALWISLLLSRLSSMIIDSLVIEIERLEGGRRENDGSREQIAKRRHEPEMSSFRNWKSQWDTICLQSLGG